MWRDRTNLYISYRQSYAHHPQKKTTFGGSSSNGFLGGEDDERRGLMSPSAFEDDGDVVIEMDLLPPRWLDVQDEVTDILTNIATETRKLEQLTQKHVLPGFDDEHVKKKEEKEIERMTQSITRQFQSCQKAMRRIDSMVRESKQSGGISKGEETMAKNLKISLAGRVGDASTLFRKKQSAYLRKLRALGGISTPLDSTGTPQFQNPYNDPSLMESESDRSFSQSTLQQARKQLHAPGLTDPLISQREREIEDIANSIIDLSNIFQEIQDMVIDQGTLLDRIDYNVERTAAEVKGADKELTVATGYQRKTLKRKIILLLLILVAGMFILLGLKISGKKNSSSPSPAPAPGAEAGTEPKAANGILRFSMKPRSSRSDIGESLHRSHWRRRRKRPLLQELTAM